MYFIVSLSYRGFLDKNTKLWVGCNVECENICNICAAYFRRNLYICGSKHPYINFRSTTAKLPFNRN